MQLSVDYKKIGATKATESDIQTTANLIAYAIQNHYKDGLDGNGGLRRTYGRIQRKLEQAIEDKNNLIDFETAEIEMIKKSVQAVKFPAEWSKFVMFLEDAVDEAMAQPVASIPAPATATEPSQPQA